MQKKLVLASNNKGKIREFNALFASRGIEVVAQGTLGVTECEEPYGTFLENALAKARNAARQTGLPAMADDSGITAHALVTEPGVHSARYAGVHSDDAANNAKLVAALKDKDDKRAAYTCVLVAVRSADDPDPVVAQASWCGEIGKTAAELTAEEKNAVSHRGRAMARMLAALGERWGW